MLCNQKVINFVAVIRDLDILVFSFIRIQLFYHNGFDGRHADLTFVICKFFIESEAQSLRVYG